MAIDLPGWVSFPEDDWVQISPAEAGIDPERFAAFIDGLEVREASFGGEDHSDNRYGTVIARGGYLIHAWGDRHYRHHTASVGKAFMRAILGCAVADGLVDPDEPIAGSWTGESQLSHPHKYLNRGHHQKLSWRHLVGPKDESLHYGGFPMELGIRWREKRSGLEQADATPGVPEWANWTGDPFYDLYAHIEPGTVGHYSSAGFWRLSQALTAVWGRDLKDIVQERLFDPIGIPAQRWDWFCGDYVKDQKYFYPEIPDSYTYLDPPYEIDGIPGRSGPGWVVISASDLARFGHLNATQGIWKGVQVIDPEWLRGHGGGNKSGASGESRHFTALGVVTTEGVGYAHSTETQSFMPENVFSGPVSRS